MSKYQYTDDMSELSHVGGEYEVACRAMVVAGLEYLDDNPDMNPRFHSYPGVYGHVTEDNDDAKKLSAVLIKAASDCSSAMHQLAISHIVYIVQCGWDDYRDALKARKLLESL